MLALALLALAVPSGGVIADALAGGGPDQTQLTLRLPDLGPGYLNVDLEEEQEDRIFCHGLTTPEDTPPALRRVILRYHPRGCLTAFSRLYEVPEAGPTAPIVASGVIALPSARAAAAVWRVVPIILGRVRGDRIPSEVRPTEKIGRATRLFHGQAGRRLAGGEGGRETFLVWRSGNTLALTFVSGKKFGLDDRIAARLAQLQQRHIEQPTPYTGAERFDGEVPLDDPAINLPVYWLGRSFRPGGGLPPNHLFDSGFGGKATPESTDHPFEGGPGLEEPPGAPLFIRYENLRLDTWPAPDWHVYADSKTGRAITSWKCTQTRTLTLPEGTATIFGGYGKDRQRCPKFPPVAFTAWVEVGGEKVVVNPPFCPTCIEVVNPYRSFAAFEAIVRGLQLRPRRPL